VVQPEQLSDKFPPLMGRPLRAPSAERA